MNMLKIAILPCLLTALAVADDVRSWDLIVTEHNGLPTYFRRDLTQTECVVLRATIAGARLGPGRTAAVQDMRAAGECFER